MLAGVGLPASKQELVEYAAGQNGGTDFVADLQSLPDRQYRSLDDVGEALLPVQPSPSRPLFALAHEESDRPPGGDDYTTPSPEPGAVRSDWPEDHPPDKVVQRQSEKQKTQKQRQDEQL